MFIETTSLHLRFFLHVIFSNLEILPVIVRHLNFKFCIAAFYRPANSPSSIFDTTLYLVL